MQNDYDMLPALSASSMSNLKLLGQRDRFVDMWFVDKTKCKCSILKQASINNGPSKRGQCSVDSCRKHIERSVGSRT